MRIPKRVPRTTFEALEPRVLLSADLVPDIPLTWTDPDGTVVTATLSGPGRGEITGHDSARDAVRITLSGTNEATQLRLAARGGDGLATLSEVSAASGSLGALLAPEIVLDGVIRVEGTLGQLVLHGARRAAVQSDALLELTTGADFDSALVLGRTDAEGFVLGNALVGGRLGGQWSIGGRAGSVQAGVIGSDWRGAFGGAVTSVATTGDFAGHLLAPSVLQLAVGGAMTGAQVWTGLDLGSDLSPGGTGAAADQLVAGNLVRLRVRGDVSSSEVRVGLDPAGAQFDDGNDRAATAGGALRELRVGGTLDSLSLIQAASLPPTVFVGGSATDPSTLAQFQAGPRDRVAPQLRLALAADTGTSTNDRLTRDPSVVATFSDLGGTDHLIASVNGGAEFEIPVPAGARDLVLFGPGDPHLPPDGRVVVRAHAVDRAGNTSEVSELTFDLDSAEPAAPTLKLARTSDTGAPGDGTTSAASVVLTGTTEAGNRVLLNTGAGEALAAADGTFAFTDVALTTGANTFTARVTDPAGNTAEAQVEITRSGDAQDDAASRWIAEVLEAVRRDAAIPPAATRALAMASLAMLDVVNAIEGAPAFFTLVAAPAEADAAAGVAQAAHDVLAALFPAQAALFDARLDESLAAVTDVAARTAGSSLGRAVAERVLAGRASDGWDAFATLTGDTAPGRWRPTGPAFEAAQAPHWADVTPFALAAPDSLRPGPPPDLGSARYAEALAEVQSLGRLDAAARTEQQTLSARFWADGAGTDTPPGHWNRIALEAARRHGNSLTANVRLFAMLNVALADTSVAAWDAKVAYRFWRPESAIQQAGEDGNAATVADPGWRPLLLSPNHPEYVSGHSAYSAAAAALLATTFGDESFETTSAGLPGVTRTFGSWDEAAQDAGRSRIYGGIHFEFSNQAGQALGRAVATEVLARFDTRQDVHPPVIALDRDSIPAAAAGNVTLRGRVSDALSGVERLEVAQGTTGPFAPLAFDETGAFSFTTAAVLDGNGDGPQVLRLRTADRAGNISAETRADFTLDTRAPAITLATFREGVVLESGARLRGTADGTGSPLVSLTYAIDGGTPHPVRLDSGGGFLERLDLGDLAPGNHVLALQGHDAAGNLGTHRLAFVVEATPELLVASLAPEDSSTEVGVTFRPQVRFTRAIDPATLTPDTFYATDAGGRRLAANVVLGDGDRTAWLFFESPLPGASRITVTLDGGAIRSADGATGLDGVPHGTPDDDFVTTFTTVSTAGVFGTSLTGRVVDPGPDLKPMTFDDLRAGPDGALFTADDAFLSPIANAHVYLLGREDHAVFTDAQGRFTLTDVPAGNVKVVIDGRTASNAPSGQYWPEMVMDANLVPGEANTLMGTMGSHESRAAHRDRDEVYLPRLQQSLLVPVSTTEVTSIRPDATAAPLLTDAQRSQVRLDVVPGSVVGEDGHVITTAQVGIATVPPELVRDMLPPGVLQHTFDITIQAPGAAVFSTPLALTLPNVFGAAPGTKLNFLSFDHTTGRLVIEGTATVSEDGLSATTDPGTGITKPGWHGLTPPGSDGGNGPPPGEPCDPSEDAERLQAAPEAEGLENRLFWSDEDYFLLKFENPDYLEDAGRCEPDFYIESVRVKIELEEDDRRAKLFLDGLESQEFELVAGASKEIRVELKDLVADRVSADDRLYGTRVLVQILSASQEDEDTPLLEKTFYVYRYLDMRDAEFGAMNEAHNDGILEFPRTVADGSGGVERRRDVYLETTPESQPQLSFEDDTHFKADGFRLIFDPGTSQPSLETKLKLITPGPLSDTIGESLTLRGDGKVRTTIDANRDQLLAELHETFIDALQPGGHVSPALFTGPELALIGTEPARQTFADLLIAAIEAKFASYPEGVGLDDSPASVELKWESSPDLGDFGLSSVLDLDVGGMLNLLIGPASTFTSGELSFLVSELLDRSPMDWAEIYIDSHFETSLGLAPLDLSLDQALAAISKTVAHETGHVLGLAHTAQMAGSSALQEEFQFLTLTGGDATSVFALEFHGHSSIPLPRFATPGQVQAALESLPSVGFGNVEVFSVNPGGPFGVHFRRPNSQTLGGDLAGIDLPELTVPVTTNGLTASVVTYQDGEGLLLIGPSVPGGDTDIMAGGRLDPLGTLTFQPPMSGATLPVALATYWSDGHAHATFNLWANMVAASGLPGTPETFFSRIPASGAGLASFAEDARASRPAATYAATVPGPALLLLDEQRSAYLPSLDFGTTRLGAPDAERTVHTLHLANVGSEPVTIRRLDAGAAGGAFGSNLVPPGTTIEPGAFLAVEVRFDPRSAGTHQGRLIVETDEDRNDREIPLSGRAIDAHGDLVLDIPNNNTGGQLVGGGALRLEGFGWLRNAGASDLRITDVRIAEGSDVFALAGLPAVSEANPLMLAPGGALAFSLDFDPSRAGLSRGVLEVRSDDAESPLATSGLTGTGLDAAKPGTARGAYVAVESAFDRSAPVLRAKADAAGAFRFFLPPDTPLHHAVFDPHSGRIAHGWDTSAGAGDWTRLTSGTFVASRVPDSDNDGLPDDIEFAIGSSSVSRDSDGDGIDDFTEIRNGSSPLDEDAARVGVIAAAQLAGPATKVAIGTLPQDGRVVAAVATGAAGIAFVDVSDAAAPVVMREVDLAGTAVDVAFDAARGLAVVAAGDGGLHRVGLDGSTLTIPERTRAVAVSEGVVYAAITGTDHVRAYDLLTAELLQTLDTGFTVDALAVDGNGLFATTTDDRFLAIDITPEGLVVRDALPLAFRAGGVFVGKGTAYLGRDDGVNGGFATIDVRDRRNLVLVSDPDSRSIAAAAIIPNGTGLAFGIARAGGPSLGALDIADVRDLSDTGRFLSRIPLGAAPQDIELAGGRAFVAAGNAGLLVVNPLAADTRGNAPTVTIDVAALDQDPARSGIQVSEGSRLTIPVTIADDVQVRAVEFFIDGERVSTREAFPFDGTVRLPTLLALGRGTVQLSVRATDTGGNAGAATPVTLELVADTVAPVITTVNVSEGDVKGRNFRTIVLGFSEAMDPNTLDARTVTLTGPSGVRAPADIQFRQGGRQVQFTYEPLAEGEYALALDRTRITDLAGNAVGAGTDTRTFTVRPFSVTWVRPTGGKWHDPANWSTGVLPGPDDDVLIALPAGETVVADFPGGESFPGFPPQAQAGDVAVGSIVATAGLRMAGDGQFAVHGPASIERLVIDRTGDVIFDGETLLGSLDLGGASLSGRGDVTLSGPFSWSGGTMSGQGRTVLTGDWSGGGRLDAGRVLENRGRGTVTSGLELNAGAIGVGHLVNAADATLTVADGADITGFSLSDRDPEVPASFTNQGTLLFRGTGQSDIDVGFTNAGSITVEDARVSWLDHTTIGGTVNVTGNGTFVFSGSEHDVTNGARLDLGPNASLRLALSRDVRIAAGAAIAGPGSVRVQSGTLQLASDQSLGTLALDGGVLRIAAGTESSVAGALEWFSGTVTGGGTLVVPGTLHIGAPGRTGGTPVLDGGTVLENRSAGTLHPQARLNLNAGTDPGAGTFLNALAAVLTLDAGNGASPLSVVAGNAGPTDPGTAALFDNRGTIRKTGTAAANIGAPWTTTGPVEIAGGELSLSGSSTLDGTLRFSSGTALSVTAGTHVLTPAATLDTDATFRLDIRGSAVFEVAPQAALSLSGHVDISGLGELAVGGTLRAGTLALATGTADITGSLALTTGDSTWTGGRMTGGGTLTIEDGARLTIGGDAATRTQLLGGLTIVNEGTLVDAGHRTGLRVELDGNAVVDNRGTFEIQGAGEWNHQATPAGSLTVRNTGLLSKPTGSGTFSFLDTTLESSGAISVQLGALRFPGTVQHTGSTQVASGATLVLGAQTIAGPFPQVPPAPFAALGETVAGSDTMARKQRDRTGRESLRALLGDLNAVGTASSVDWTASLQGWRWRSSGALRA